MSKNKPALGILGGMGPLATVDFMRKVIGLTPADHDQDHFPMTVASLPQVPDRTRSILNGDDAPLPVMLGGIDLLNSAGVACLAVPCNSAHYWYDALAEAADAPILHIADSVISALDNRGINARAVGILGTSGVIAAEIYQKRLDELGLEHMVPDVGDQQEQVMGGIYCVKSGDMDRGRDLLSSAVEGLRRRGADAVILGCTEIPIVVDDGGDIVDATLALARASVDFLIQAEKG